MDTPYRARLWLTSRPVSGHADEAIKQGFDVVFAKISIADSWESYEHLMQTACLCRLPSITEATVGAGLPIYRRLQKAHLTGDRVRRIEGSVSLFRAVGVVGWPRLRGGCEAMARGYAEPDPREDLSGRDAMRKALILARLLGYRGGPPAAEDLMPPAFRSLPVANLPGAIA